MCLVQGSGPKEGLSKWPRGPSDPTAKALASPVPDAVCTLPQTQSCHHSRSLWPWVGVLVFAAIETCLLA